MDPTAIFTTTYTPWPLFIFNAIVFLLGFDIMLRGKALFWPVDERIFGFLITGFSLPLVLTFQFLAFIFTPFFIRDEATLQTIMPIIHVAIAILLPLLGILFTVANVMSIRMKRTIPFKLGFKLGLQFLVLVTALLGITLAGFYDVATEETTTTTQVQPGPGQPPENAPPPPEDALQPPNNQQEPTTRQRIGASILPALALVYVGLFGSVALISREITAPLRDLNEHARQIADGNYAPIEVQEGGLLDEVEQLKRVFNIMVDKVGTREENLKQEVKKLQLQIKIDRDKVKEEVGVIENSDFFQDLQAKAKNMRRRSGKDDD